MNQAGQRLQRGQSGPDEQEETLDRLNEAQGELRKSREEAERTVGTRASRQSIRSPWANQAASRNLVAEGRRIQKALAQGAANDRPELLSLLQLGRNQSELGQETAQVTEEKLSEAKSLVGY